MIIITHISYHIISPTQNYLSNKVPMMIPGDCNPCHRSHKNGGFTQFKIILIFIVKINQIWKKKNIIRRFTEAVWDALEAGWPVLASFSSREFFWWNFFDEQRFRWKKIWWKHIMVLMIKHWIFLKHLSTLRYELNNMHHKSPTKSLKNKVISNFPKQMCPLRWTATTHI